MVRGRILLIGAVIGAVIGMVRLYVVAKKLFYLLTYLKISLKLRLQVRYTYFCMIIYYRMNNLVYFPCIVPLVDNFLATCFVESSIQKFQKHNSLSYVDGFRILTSVGYFSD